jgi:hypothetical protein
MADAQTSGTVSPERPFMGGVANGRVGWNAVRPVTDPEAGQIDTGSQTQLTAGATQDDFRSGLLQRPNY